MNEGKQYIPELCKLRLIKMTVTLNYCLLLLILSTHHIYLLAFLKTLQQTHSIVQQLRESL